MKIREIVQTTPNFRVLSEDEIERIYFDALGVIARDGARVKSGQALKLFEHSEAVVTDYDLVRIPAVLVEKALQSHPGKIILAGRTGQYSVRSQKDELAFGAGPVHPLDQPGGSVYEDVYNAARLADFITNFDFIAGPLRPSPKNGDSWNLSYVPALVEGSSKPLLLGTADKNELSTLWRMMSLISGGEKEFRLSPGFAHYVEIDSPLTLSRVEAKKLLFCAEKQIPCVCASRAVSGVTAPAAVAGTLVQTLAETMLVSVLSYLENPGMPLIRGGITTIPDSSGAGCSFGAPELALTTAANTDVSKWLGLGMLFPAGITDSAEPGQDAGTDFASGLFYAFLSGADLICGSGLINSAKEASLDGMVMCAEIIEMIKQIGKGISTDEEYLAMDLIESVGPGGEYLTCDHTLDHWHEWFRPNLINRATYDMWAADGKKTMKDRAAEERKKILEEHEPAALDPKLAAELKALAGSGK